jgi:glutamate-1-semialdehyde 2,1-aminomutase
MHPFEERVRSQTAGSEQRYARARHVLAGGVSSGLRRSAKPYPLYFTHGEGSQVWDVDGNRYLDYGLAWGPLILGHAPPRVVERVREQAGRGFTFGAQHDLEIEVAEKLVEILPCADRVCFANSGTEMVEVALRLARAVTVRRKYLKFEGHYHGWSDQALVSYHPTAEQAAAGKPVPVGAGQLPHDHVVIVEWNDRAGVERALAEHEISAIFCEALLCNSGCVPAEPGFLDFLREQATRAGALLVFDEVITGFRLGLAGAQGRYRITPDLAVYAKAVGAGAPLSVMAGRAEYMDWISEGKVVHAGTLNGNPLALAAAAAALDELAAHNGDCYHWMRERADRLRHGLESILRAEGHDVITTGDGPVFTLHFMKNAPRTYRDTLAGRGDLYAEFAMGLLAEGVIVLPDGRWYLSAAHSETDIERTLAAAQHAARF